MAALFDMILLGTAAAFACRLILPRTNGPPTARADPEPAPAAITVSHVHLVDEPRTGSKADKISTTDMPTYLLGSARVGNSLDRTRMVMDMLSGPGICTPREA